MASTTFVPSPSPLLSNNVSKLIAPNHSAFFPSAPKPTTVVRAQAIGDNKGKGGAVERRHLDVGSSFGKSSDEKWIHRGVITESLPNGMFRVRLGNGDLILGYISGKIRKNVIRILPGDRVNVEVSRYDSTKGRIIYRLGNKDV